jgi:hypothetical protein
MPDPRVRLGHARKDVALEEDPEWAKCTDTLAEAIFARVGPRRVAEAVAADIVAAIKAGRSLSQFDNRTGSHPEVYAVGLEEAPRVLRLTEQKTLNGHSRDALEAARSACGDPDPDPNLVQWAQGLCNAVTDWRCKSKPRAD